MSNKNFTTTIKSNKITIRQPPQDAACIDGVWVKCATPDAVVDVEFNYDHATLLSLLPICGDDITLNIHDPFSYILRYEVSGVIESWEIRGSETRDTTCAITITAKFGGVVICDDSEILPD